MPKLVAYPASFPLEALQIFKDKLTGGSATNAECGLAGWNVVGYGLSIGLPVPQSIGAFGATDEPEADQIAALDALISGGKSLIEIKGADANHNAQELHAVGFPVGLFAIALKLAVKFLLAA